MSSRLVFVLILVVVLAAAGYWYYRAQQEQPPAPAHPVGPAVAIAAPLGLPPVPVPADNPPTAATIALGRRLYYDPQLSVDNTVACASCHHPDFGFSDGKQFSEGVQGKKGGRNAPTVFNAAYYTVQFWDGRAPSLEEQAAGPMQNPVEMAHTLAGVEQKLNADPGYREAFQKAFGSDRITIGMATQAIASFERTVVSGNSPFDRYLYGADKKAFIPSPRAPKRGTCAPCHALGEQHALFTDNKFHNRGVGVIFSKEGEPVMKDLGRYEVTKQEADQGAFKTPSLRNIALTAPYMHDGSLKTM